MQARTQNKTVKEGLEEFIAVKTNENVSRATIRDYTDMVGIFMSFYGEDSLCINITDNTVQKYIAFLREKPKKKNNPKDDTIEYLSDQSIVTYIRHLRTVLNFFMDREYINRFKVILPRAEKRVKPTYLESDLDSLLKKPDLKTCRFSVYRNWAMTNFFVAIGNRLSTVRNLKIQDLDFQENKIWLRAVKNKRQYSIPMAKELKKILQEYLSYRKGEPSDYVFCSENDDKKPLAESSIKTAVYRYNTRKGVSQTSSHSYRRYFSKHYIQKGGKQMALKSILGHKTLTMVLEYVDLYGDDLNDGFDEYNPLSAYAKGERVSMKK